MGKILIIDDDDKIRNLYMRLLKTAELDVREAANAQEAVGVLIEESIDLILLDLRMPDYSGKELFDAIEDYNPNIKVIVSSVYPLDKQRQIVPRALDYFDKSQGSAILLDKIRHALAPANGA